MCGIVGIAYRDPQRPVAEPLVRAMCHSMRHRGPDGEGFALCNGAALGARRLSVIDLEGGHQPMWNEDNSVAIAFNGEIYNHRDVRRRMQDRGHRFRTSCDTEAVLHLCEEAGADAPRHLRGMFAFAVWDDRSRELLLGRDRFGIKPLYYTHGPWGIAFASELKTLVQCGLTNRALDWSALDMYFELGYIVAPATPFLDERKVPAGHTLRWRDGDIDVSSYWDLPYEVAGASASPTEVREWLDDSVEQHLISDVPVATFLSGGLDSSAVLSSAAMRGPAPHAFTARYHGSGAHAADETALATTLAARYGAPLTIVDVHPDVATIFEPIILALDEPHADDSAIPSWILSQRVAQEYKVALTGIGGDELFGGYRRHIGAMAAEIYRGVPRGIRRGLAKAAGWLPEPGNGAGISRLKRFLAVDEDRLADRYLGLVRRLSDTEREALYARDLVSATMREAASRSFCEAAAQGGSGHALTTALYLDYKTFLSDDVLALADRISMAHGLELRVPLVDHELVERIFPLPPRAKVGLMEKKQLLRRALRPRLPQAHFAAPKRGFVGPTGAWLRKELRPMLTDMLSSDAMRRLGYFDHRAVSALVDDHLSRRRDRETSIWALLCFTTWHRLFVEQTPLSASDRDVAPSRARTASGRASAGSPRDPAAVAP